MDLRILKLRRNVESIFSFKELKENYLLLTANLNSEYKNELIQTQKEETVFALLKSHTRLAWYRSVWIGQRNIDLFCPSLTSLPNLGKSFQGLVIEVDGCVHNQQLKMNRDNGKYCLLHKLRIATYTIENEDLQKESFKSFLKELGKLTRLDSRARKRVWRNVFLYTLATHCNKPTVKLNLNDLQLNLLEEIRGKYV